LADVYRAVESRPPARLHRCKPNSRCVVGRNIVPILASVMDGVEAVALGRLAETTVAHLAERVRRRG
jgi:hypothetical protein